MKQCDAKTKSGSRCTLKAIYKHDGVSLCAQHLKQSTRHSPNDTVVFADCCRNCIHGILEFSYDEEKETVTCSNGIENFKQIDRVCCLYESQRY